MSSASRSSPGSCSDQSPGGCSGFLCSILSLGLGQHCLLASGMYTSVVLAGAGTTPKKPVWAKKKACRSPVSFARGTALRLRFNVTFREIEKIVLNNSTVAPAVTDRALSIRHCDREGWVLLKIPRGDIDQGVT